MIGFIYNFLDNIIGVSEDTTTGVYRLLDLDKKDSILFLYRHWYVVVLFYGLLALLTIFVLRKQVAAINTYKCLNMEAIADIWVNQAQLDIDYCQAAIGIAAGESYDTTNCPKQFDPKAENQQASGLWQLTHGDGKGESYDQAKTVWNKYMSNNEYGCCSTWAESSSIINGIGQDLISKKKLQTHRFCSANWTGAETDIKYYENKLKKVEQYEKKNAENICKKAALSITRCSRNSSRTVRT